MCTTPPHPLIRYRHALLALAIAAWAVAGVTLLQFKGSADVPVALIVSMAALVFIWANGAYWWVLFRYPYIEVAKGQYASHDEWKEASHGGFLVAYLAAAVFATVACIKVAVNG